VYGKTPRGRACPSIFQPLSGGARLLEHARLLEEIRYANSHSPIIHKTENDTECHLADTDDDRSFHLQRVQEVQFVRRQIPHRIDTERIRSHVFLE
jgi:hypothetical protein